MLPKSMKDTCEVEVLQQFPLATVMNTYCSEQFVLHNYSDCGVMYPELYGGDCFQQKVWGW